MKLDLSAPILYLITRGETAETTTAESPAFLKILDQVSAAIAAGIDLIQIREKQLSARVMFELAARAVELARGTPTRVLVNDRADIAAGAGAAGVHLTTGSIDAGTIRKTFGKDFLIGASTHSLDEARAARDGDADFAVFGPIFETSSKSEYGPPKGLKALTESAQELAPFPLLALGGVSIENASECLAAGARGIAGISLFAAPATLTSTAETIRRRHD
jgi:thiamine-phosphate pyrophosphorylase